MDKELKKALCVIVCHDNKADENTCCEWNTCTVHRDIEQAFLADGYVQVKLALCGLAPELEAVLEKYREKARKASQKFISGEITYDAYIVAEREASEEADSKFAQVEAQLAHCQKTMALPSADELADTLRRSFEENGYRNYKEVARELLDFLRANCSINSNSSKELPDWEKILRQGWFHCQECEDTVIEITKSECQKCREVKHD